MQKEIGLGSFNVALTSDVWSGRAKQDYVSVVAHYVDKDWTMQKRILGFRLLDDRHTGANIAERVLNVIAEWDLTTKVVSITLDNASNNGTAITVIRDRLSGYHEELIHQRCACHILNLMVQDGMKVFIPSIQKIRQATTYVMASNSRVAKWASYCRSIRMAPKHFNVDQKHRWNSTWLMIHACLPYKELLTAFVNRELKSVFLTDFDWSILSLCHEFF